MIARVEMRREYWRGSGAGKMLHGKVETVMELTYLGDRMRAGGGCCDCQKKICRFDVQVGFE